MVVHHDSAEGHLEIVVSFQHLSPLYIIVEFTRCQITCNCWLAWNVTCLIIATDLEVASVFAEAHRDLSLFDYALLLHNVIDWLKPVQVHRRSIRAESQDTIGLLTVEVLGLRMHTAKGILKHVEFSIVALAKIQCVLHNVAFVAAALRVTLIELAQVVPGT